MVLTFLPVKMRLPLKFGAETIDSIQIAHVELDAYGTTGRGETPLSVAWAWPSELSFAFRERMMMDFCRTLEKEYRVENTDPMSAGYAFLTHRLPEIHAAVPAGAGAAVAALGPDPVRGGGPLFQRQPGQRRPVRADSTGSLLYAVLARFSGRRGGAAGEKLHGLLFYRPGQRGDHSGRGDPGDHQGEQHDRTEGGAELGDEDSAGELGEDGE